MSKIEKEARPPIPEPLKRKVRQRCGFGCVLCGCPIYDYEHLEEYSAVREHTFDNLALLCPTCHRKKTRNLISKNDILGALAFEEKRDRTAPDTLPTLNKLIIGGNVVQEFSGIALAIYDFCYVEVRYKPHPVINALFLDENRRAAILVEENEYTLSAETWDIQYVGQKLTFRNGLRGVFAELTFDVESKTLIIEGEAKLSNGVRVRIRNDGVYANENLLIAKSVVLQSEAGIVVTNDDQIDSLHASSAENVWFDHCAVISNGPAGPSGTPFFQGATVTNSVAHGLTGIAALNCRDVTNNVFAKCEQAFVWTERFLTENFAP